MKQNLEISIFEVIGSPLCVASSDGQKIFDRLAPAFNKEQKVKLSFNNVNMLTSAFLNAAIGQLYGTYSEEQIRSLLDVQDIQADDRELLRRVVETAKQYFKNQKKFDQTIHDSLENDNDDV